MLSSGVVKEPIDQSRVQLYRHNPSRDGPYDEPTDHSRSSNNPNQWLLEDITGVQGESGNRKASPIIYIEIVGYSLDDLRSGKIREIKVRTVEGSTGPSTLYFGLYIHSRYPKLAWT